MFYKENRKAISGSEDKIKGIEIPLRYAERNSVTLSRDIKNNIRRFFNAHSQGNLTITSDEER
jgi:hypothetical protein